MFHFSKGSLTKALKQMFRRLNAPYKLSIINEQNLQESITILLTKKSLYIFVSSLFVAFFLLFSVLTLFTPLKYYLPGFKNDISRKEMIRLQKLSDSLLILHTQQEQFIFNLIQVSNGGYIKTKDTQRLSQKEISLANQLNGSRIDRASRYDYLKSIKRDSSLWKQDSLQTKSKQDEKVNSEKSEKILKQLKKDSIKLVSDGMKH
jgi:hypothetical protein